MRAWFQRRRRDLSSSSFVVIRADKGRGSKAASRSDKRHRGLEHRAGLDANRGRCAARRGKTREAHSSIEWVYDALWVPGSAGLSGCAVPGRGGLGKGDQWCQNGKLHWLDGDLLCDNVDWVSGNLSPLRLHRRTASTRVANSWPASSGVRGLAVSVCVWTGD